MTVLAIKIGHSCTGCGECDKLLPGLRAEVAKRGSIFANPYNPDVDWERITEAMHGCVVGALTMDEVA